MATGPQAPKLWRSTRTERAPSIDSSFPSVQGGYTFGLKAPIVDFFGQDYITKFATLEDVLLGKADEIMNEAYKVDPMEEEYIPWTAGGYNFRWIHIPANNMVWVEELIKQVCKSKEEQRAKKEKVDNKQMKKKVLKASEILRAKYWKDQQRGCLEHCANHPLYARHMVPFFAEIPTDWETATASIVAPSSDSTLVEDLSKIKTPVTPASGLNLDTKTMNEPETGTDLSKIKTPVTPASGINLDTKSMNEPETGTDHNMVLFMPYLHWATSGEALDHRYSVIRELAEKFRDPFYRRPTPEEIERELDQSTKLKIIRAFLQPKNDKCLHIRRTLDQYYYSTLPDADERTIDQVVYKFAKKQHNRKMEETEKAKQKELERSESSLRSSRSGLDAEIEPIGTDAQDEKRVEASWDPPRVMMVNQLWMWIIDGDTVITSFPAKSKSELSMDDRVNKRDYMEGDDIYDSTDIWRAVQRELRHRTTYGQRTAKSALDLAWTIADQARGVFQRRDLHPHLQFIQMFEMEINEITFHQAKSFATFSRNVKAAHNANNIGKLLNLLSTFQKENSATTQAEAWKDNFRVFAIDFKRKFNQTVREAQAQARAQGTHWPALVDISTPYPSDSARLAETWAAVLKHTYNELQETIEHRKDINLTYEDIEAQLLERLMARFTDLETIVMTAHSTSSLSKKLNSLVKAAFKSLEWYTDLAMDHLFDITTETNLMTEIKDILDELNIMGSVQRQQASVIKPFMRDMLNQSLDTLDKSFHDSTRLEIQIEELQKTAQSTYTALQDLLDLKQKQASVIEARAARKDTKSSADQAEASASLAYESFKQGWAIMIFTIVTIIFLPLSFFTGLFGMNAKELLSSQYSMGFYSVIMYPVSFLIICISLGLALKPEFRSLVHRVLKKMINLWLGLFLPLWKKTAKLRRRLRRRARKPARNLGRVEESTELEWETNEAWDKV